MPLESGGGQKVIGRNISELMRKYAKKRRIGNIRPKNKKQAAKISAAIAYRKARGS
jgi:hypothetical protein